MIDGGAEVRSREADERGWDARLDERMRGDGWPSTYPYERRISPKPYRALRLAVSCRGSTTTGGVRRRVPVHTAARRAACRAVRRHSTAADIARSTLRGRAVLRRPPARSHGRAGSTRGTCGRHHAGRQSRAEPAPDSGAPVPRRRDCWPCLGCHSTCVEPGSGGNT